MFGKNNTYMFPHVSQNSLHSRVDLNNGIDLTLHHDVLAGHYLAAAAANAHPVVGPNNSNNLHLSFDHQSTTVASGDPTTMVSPRKHIVKRDRHSKIYTSQGPRDRRVRLSIGIARKFFDLQELLGFDKPSKTLDWLLTKSKTAIKDLLLQTKQKAAENSTTECCEVDSLRNLEASELENSYPEKGKSVDNKLKLGKDPQQIAAKESRVKARARARERTREKMCIKQMNESKNIPIQYMNSQLNDFCKISGFSPSSGAARKVIKNPSSIWGFHQNLSNTRDSSSPICSLPFPYNETWDFMTSSQPSNLYAILDQHRFFNSNTSNN